MLGVQQCFFWHAERMASLERPACKTVSGTLLPGQVWPLPRRRAIVWVPYCEVVAYAAAAARDTRAVRAKEKVLWPPWTNAGARLTRRGVLLAFGRSWCCNRCTPTLAPVLKTGGDGERDAGAREAAALLAGAGMCECKLEMVWVGTRRRLCCRLQQRVVCWNRGICDVCTLVLLAGSFRGPRLTPMLADTPWHTSWCKGRGCENMLAWQPAAYPNALNKLHKKREGIHVRSGCWQCL